MPEQWVGQPGLDPAGVGVEQRDVRRVLAGGMTLVVGEQQARVGLHGRRSRPAAQRSGRRGDDRMCVEVGHVRVPVVVARAPQLVERVEHRELHVRLDPVDHRDPAVRVREPVDADLPRLSRLGLRQVRVGHDDPLPVAAARQHLLEPVVTAVLGREDEDVRDGIQEAGAQAGTAAVAVTYAAREEMERAVVRDRAGVEDRLVAGHRPSRDDRGVADASRGDLGQGYPRCVGPGHGWDRQRSCRGDARLYRGDRTKGGGCG